MAAISRIKLPRLQHQGYVLCGPCQPCCYGWTFVAADVLVRRVNQWISFSRTLFKQLPLHWDLEWVSLCIQGKNLSFLWPSGSPDTGPAAFQSQKLWVLVSSDWGAWVWAKTSCSSGGTSAIVICFPFCGSSHKDCGFCFSISHQSWCGLSLYP